MSTQQQSLFNGFPAPLYGSDATFSDANVSGSVNLSTPGTTTDLMTSEGSMIGFYGVPAVSRATTAIVGSTTVVAGTGSGNILAASTTFNGYTLLQIVAALTNVGILSTV